MSWLYQWIKCLLVQEDVKTIISHVGPQTLFFIFPSADMHWPELHALFGSENDRTAEHRHPNVVNSPHITNWFFTQGLEKVIKFWSNNLPNAEEYWYRFEYQARGSIHCHGVAKLKNGPGPILPVCGLVGIHIPSSPFRRWYLAKIVNSSLSETSQPHREY